ncbi:hypothetical protein E9232_003433 [Inquilinus ginsengisoli]|uniref:Lipocalin-like domain-containing protein n=1 Tax=Inquilinus ginsengisoli TaxID=363840 RepID=A0ABU1JRG6_9PROT|nr:hypothetical protein [Inquilinus ginsengisoli]MDR6290907.1 hypothetical protein [Inquilinus ginsengisoli]
MKFTDRISVLFMGVVIVILISISPTSSQAVKKIIGEWVNVEGDHLLFSADNIFYYSGGEGRYRAEFDRGADVMLSGELFSCTYAVDVILGVDRRPSKLVLRMISKSGICPKDGIYEYLFNSQADQTHEDNTVLDSALKDIGLTNVSIGQTLKTNEIGSRISFDNDFDEQVSGSYMRYLFGTNLPGVWVYYYLDDEGKISVIKFFPVSHPSKLKDLFIQLASNLGVSVNFHGARESKVYTDSCNISVSGPAPPEQHAVRITVIDDSVQSIPLKFGGTYLKYIDHKYDESTIDTPNIPCTTNAVRPSPSSEKEEDIWVYRKMQ